MRKRISRSRLKEQADLNIIPYLNLMMVLVSFFLMTAVFTQLSMIDLHLPSLGDGTQGKNDKPDFNLQVTIRDNEIILSDTQGGLIRKIDKSGKTFDYKLLNATLQQVKARFPDKTNATILSEPKTDYNTLVQVMDAVRMYVTVIGGKVKQGELFPDISIGDAPR